MYTGRVLLYCCVLYGVSSSAHIRIEWLPRPFIAQDMIVTRRPEARHVALRWLEPYYSI
jgi:hypothetical protein